jgi:hypothetical protein
VAKIFDAKYAGSKLLELIFFLQEFLVCGGEVKEVSNGHSR